MKNTSNIWKYISITLLIILAVIAYFIYTVFMRADKVAPVAMENTQTTQNSSDTKQSDVMNGESTYSITGVERINDDYFAHFTPVKVNADAIVYSNEMTKLEFAEDISIKIDPNFNNKANLKSVDKESYRVSARINSIIASTAIFKVKIQNGLVTSIEEIF